LHSISVENCTAYQRVLTCLAYEQGVQNDKHGRQSTNHSVLARKDLIEKVNINLTQTDKEFFLSFEQGEPDWTKCCAGDLSNYPSIQWKLQNIDGLKKTNPKKFNEGVGKLRDCLLRP
jgi:hypothetical protein